MRHDIHILNPNARYINQAIDLLEKGNLVLYPTDTVYGMGCSIYQKKALERLYRIKGKSPSDPMSLICDSIQQAAGFAKINNFAFKILKRCMPGPFTIILEATRETPKLLLGKKREIGIRIPDSNTCRMLVEGLGHPLVNSSASNETLEDQLDGDFSMDYANGVDMVLDAGILADPIESTVAKITNNDIEILREGGGNPELLYL